MEAISESIFNITTLFIGVIILRFSLPFIGIWLHLRNRNWLRENGRPATAKILTFRDSGIHIGTGQSTGLVGGKMRRFVVELEVIPSNDGQPFRIKTWEELHPNDMVGIVPGMMVKALTNSGRFRKGAVVSDWGEGRPSIRGLEAGA